MLEARILGAVRAPVGDHVERNTCFRDFPANVPDTETFWVGCLLAALADLAAAAAVIAPGPVNLLALPGYARPRTRTWRCSPPARSWSAPSRTA